MQAQITTRADSRSDLCKQKTENNKQPIAGRKQKAEKGSRQLLQPVFKQVGHQQQIRFRQLLVVLVRQ